MANKGKNDLFEDNDDSGKSGDAKKASNSSGAKGAAVQNYSKWEKAYNRAFNALSLKKIADVDSGFATTETGEVLKHGESLKQDGPKHGAPKPSVNKPRPPGFGSSSSNDKEDETNG